MASCAFLPASCPHLAQLSAVELLSVFLPQPRSCMRGRSIITASAPVSILDKALLSLTRHWRQLAIADSSVSSGNALHEQNRIVDRSRIVSTGKRYLICI